VELSRPVVNGMVELRMEGNGRVVVEAPTRGWDGVGKVM
jgi:hypothetical protein